MTPGFAFRHGAPDKWDKLLARHKPLTEHLMVKLLEAGEMNLGAVLSEVRAFEAAVQPG